MKYLLTAIIILCIQIAQAQSRLTAIIIDADENTPLAGASVLWKEQNATTTSDTSGLIVFENIPDGKQTFIISYIGYEQQTVEYIFPFTGQLPVTIELEMDHHHHEEEVYVTATRTSRTISAIPTRVEVISGEELVEKGNMKPGDIRMLLNESTGIQTQQTSATSFNSGIRIQGLDGRYTQLLRDGYPLYAGFSGGLSILQIAPLDLKQVEVIKGSSSTLYGGGAIAGLVNLVSKTPGDERELSFLANATSAGGLDLSGFYSEKYGEKIGLTVFASRNSNGPFDPADIGLTAIPKFERYTINPRLFLYGKKTTADVGVSYIIEDRIGGNVNYIKNGGNGFFEENNTARITTQLRVHHTLNENSSLTFKNSYSRFARDIAIPAYQFNAIQQSSYTELNYGYANDAVDFIAGVNFLSDDLEEELHTPGTARDYHLKTYGVFVQSTFRISENFDLETGLRADYVSDYGFELLPRFSALWRVSENITTRLGGGFGYKTPTIFTEEAERRQFQNILPIDVNASRNERSVGGNWDINYTREMGEVNVSLNHLFFYTRLNRPLVLTNAGGGNLAFTNSTGFVDTKGMETNLRLIYSNFKLFVGYTYTDASTHFDNKQWLPLTARHRLNNVLMYEQEEKLKIGLEAYYFSRQRLNDGSYGKSYWIMGLMGEKIWEKFSIFLNFENFTNTRQSKFGPIYTGSIDNPVFSDIYAPVEGFVVNGGIKLFL